MFSKILFKLIDHAILPAISLVAVRVISVVLISLHFNIPFSMTGMGFTFTSPDDYIKVNSYSAFGMVLIIAIGLAYILTKSLVFHDSHVKPATAANAFAFSLHGLIQSSYDIYTQAFVWLSYLSMLIVVTGLYGFYGFMYSWVFYVAVILLIVSIAALVADVEQEIKPIVESGGLDKDGRYLA